MPRKKRKERYIDRWRKEHKEVRLYLKKEEYETLERLASGRNMTVKDFILRYINDLKTAAKGEYERAIKDFIDNPRYFYHVVRHHYKGDVAIFEAPCMYCGEPIVFTHRDNNWESEVKPALLEAFRYWYHIKCKK